MTLAEAAFGLGCEVALPDLAGRADVTLFGEGVTAAVISCAPGHRAAAGGARRRPRSAPSPTAAGSRSPAAPPRIDLATSAAETAHAATIPQAMAG